MKKLISLLLCLILVCSLGITAYAAKTEDPRMEDFHKAVQYNDRYADAVFTASVPVYSVSQNTDPFWNYENLMQHQEDVRAVGVLQGGVVTGQLCFYSRNGRDRRPGPGSNDTSIGRFVETYGNDVLILMGNGHTFVVFPQENNTLYPIGQFLEEDFTEPAAFDYTLTEFVKASTYLSIRSRIVEKRFREAEFQGFDENLKEVSEKYWAYAANRPIRERNFKIGFCIIVPLCFAGLITLAVWLSKRRKQN